MQAHRHAVIFLSLLFLGLLACAHAGKAPLPDPPQPPAPPPTLDAYGGRTDIPCATQSDAYWHVEKIGTHWYFCTPVTTSGQGGAVVPANSVSDGFVAMSFANAVTNGNPTFDCTHQATPTVTGVSWASGAITYTFTSSVPSDAIVGNGVDVSGFVPAGYNVQHVDGSSGPTTGSITAVGTNTITVKTGVANPGTATTLGTVVIDQNTFPTYAAKYTATGDPNGVTYNWGWQTLLRATSWAFNSVGQDSGAYVIASTTCSSCLWPGKIQPVPLPYINEIKPAEGASDLARSGIITDPIKGEIVATNANYNAYRGGELYDVFDPNLATYTSGIVALNTNITGNYPFLLAIFTDDSDYFWGAGAGPDILSGHTNSNIGWITLITSPVQTFIDSTPQGGKSFLYAATQNFSKSQATNPAHGTCSISNPCSLRDDLYDEYSGSISALNTSWGSNYDTFDSDGTQVTVESIATGDGTTTTFTHTLAHIPASPFSMQVSVAGTVTAGDCPWFHCGGTANTGKLESPTASYVTASTVNYSTGAISLTFVTAPASGAAIEVNYIYGGWDAGGKGLMDESGGTGSQSGCPTTNSTCWVGTNSFCLEGANPSYSSTFSCVGGGGANAVPNANANLGADIDNWVSQMAAEYFKTMHTAIRAVSNVPYFGLDVVGDYGVPAFSKFLAGMAPYVDGMTTGGVQYWTPLPSPATMEVSYQYLTQYFGDKPFMTFSVISAQSDSSYSCIADSGNDNFTAQNVRGNNWYDHVNYLLSTNGFNGDIQYVGSDWWSWQDFQDLDQGLVSLGDNAYDGNEDVTGSVTCDATYTSLINCGGENTTYGNMLLETNGVAAANLLWLGGTSKPTAPSKRSVIWGARKELQKTVSRPSPNRK